MSITCFFPLNISWVILFCIKSAVRNTLTKRSSSKKESAYRAPVTFSDENKTHAPAAVLIFLNTLVQRCVKDGHLGFAWSCIKVELLQKKSAIVKKI